MSDDKDGRVVGLTGEAPDAAAAAAGVAAAAPAIEAAPAAEPPVVIAIARDFGAEGHEIGKMLSVRLGIPLYDNELLVRVATRGGLTVEEVAEFDERPAAATGAFLPDRVDARTRGDELFDACAQVILDLGSTRPCIIVGRLAEYVLRGNPNMIAVLVTAPFEDRVEIVRAKRGLSASRGARLVRQRQREREAFYRRYSAGRCLLHDHKSLVVDRAAFGREGCCEIIEAAYRARLEAVARRRASEAAEPGA